MKLSEYLELSRETGPEFARRLGLTPQAVRYYLRGERTPKAATMARIVKATAGAVMPNDFLREDDDG